jgi:hypothetical protein
MSDVEEAFDYEDPNSLTEAIARLRLKGTGLGPKARKQQEKKVRGAVDGRTLRTTGRNAQFNFKCREDIKKGVTEAAAADGLSIAEYLERLIEADLQARGAQ